MAVLFYLAGDGEGAGNSFGTMLGSFWEHVYSFVVNKNYEINYQVFYLIDLCLPRGSFVLPGRGWGRGG